MPEFIPLAHGAIAEDKGDTNNDSPKGACKCFKFTQPDEEGHKSSE